MRLVLQCRKWHKLPLWNVILTEVVGASQDVLLWAEGVSTARRDNIIAAMKHLNPNPDTLLIVDEPYRVGYPLTKPKDLERKVQKLLFT